MSTQPSNPSAAHPPLGTRNPIPSSSASTPAARNAAQGGLPSTAPASASELPDLKVTLRNSLRQFPDFPSPGILFEDIMPIFASHALHTSLIRALELQLASVFQNQQVDVVVGLEARGFLFGPTLAMRIGAGFVPVRKQGKLPGKCVEAKYQKEYGVDVFEMQEDAIKSGQKVVVVDDIIATGGSAAAAGSLVRKLGGNLLGFVFLMELDFLKGRAKLDAPVHTLFSGQEEALKSS